MHPSEAPVANPKAEATGSAAAGAPAGAPGKERLFRREAITHSAGTQFGAPLNLDWPFARVFSAVAALLVILILAAAAIVEYAPTRKVRLTLDASGGVMQLRAPIEGMMVESVLVVEGQKVQKGQRLVVLKTNRISGSGEDALALAQGSTARQSALIKKQIADQRNEEQLKRAELSARLGASAREQEFLGREIIAGERLHASLGEQVKRLNDLVAQKFMSPQQVAPKQDEMLTQEARVESLKAARARLAGEAGLLQAELNSLRSRTEQLSAQRERELEQLQATLQSTSAANERVITAPQAATVGSISVTPGSALRAEQALLNLTPESSQRVLRLYMPSEAVAQARVGQSFNYSLDAYPSHRFGYLKATVLSVAPAALVADQGGPESTASSSMFLVLAQPQGFQLLNEVAQVRPGMGGQAFLSLEKRSILMWLLDPLIRNFHGGSVTVGGPALIASPASAPADALPAAALPGAPGTPNAPTGAAR